MARLSVAIVLACLTADSFSQTLQSAIESQQARKLTIVEGIKEFPAPMIGGVDVSNLSGDGPIRLYGNRFRVADIVDGRNMMVESGGKRLWVEGYPTDDIADGMPVRLFDFYEVVGTKQYDTVLGATQTVFHVRPVENTENSRLIANELKAMEEEKANHEEQQRLSELTRTWTLKNGKSIYGRIVSYKGSKITIQTHPEPGARRGREGVQKQVTIHSSAIADADRQLAKKHARELRANKELKK